MNDFKTFYFSRFDLGKTGGMAFTGRGNHTVTGYQHSSLSPDTFALEDGRVTLHRDGLYKFDFSLATDDRQVFLISERNNMFSRVCLKVNGECKFSAARIAPISVLSGSTLLDLQQGDVLELVAEWNSLIKRLDRCSLYFGGQLIA